MSKRIRLKLYASLGSYLPPEANDRVMELQVSDDSTPAEIIDRYQIPEHLAHLVLLNGIYLNPDERARTPFREGDTLAIWPPVAGG